MKEFRFLWRGVWRFSIFLLSLAGAPKESLYRSEKCRLNSQESDVYVLDREKRKWSEKVGGKRRRDT